MIEAGKDNKRETILISEVEVSVEVAKQALRKMVSYLDSEPISLVSFLYASSILKIKEYHRMKEALQNFDLVLIGDELVLEATDGSMEAQKREIKEQQILKMFLRILHKRRAKVYLLAESEAEARQMHTYCSERYGGIQIVGLAKVSEADGEHDKIINHINGAQADCVISMLDSPFQETFMAENKNRLDLRVFLGGGREILKISKEKVKFSKIRQIFLGYILKKELKKEESQDFSFETQKEEGEINKKE